MTGFEHHPHPSTGDTPSVVATVTGTVPVAVTVTAIVVTHGFTPYLRRTLDALRAGGTRADSVVVVDTAATEETAQYDDLHLGDARFIAAPRARSFGQAVDVALASAEVSTWLWLLHDDSAPEPDALAELLRAVEPYDTIAIAGVKQRAWQSEADGVERLLEVGLTTTALGRRVTGIGPFDIDQGQLDGQDDVLAVGLAGALVRTSAWTKLGGTDPELGPFGDGLDLCLRARRAGDRVVVVPSAVVRHAQASLNGLRRDPEARAHPDLSFGARRRSQLHARLTSVAPLTVPFAAVAMVVWAPLRAMFRLVVKQPRQARDEIVAPLWVLARLTSVIRARRNAARTAVVPRRTVHKDFVAPPRQVFAERRDRRSALAERSRVTRRPTQAELAELHAKAVARRATLTGVAATLAAVTGVLFAPLLGPLADRGRAIGGGLLPAGTSLADVWRSVSTGWIGTGMGEAAPADPFGWFLLAVTALAGGSSQTAVNAVVVLAFAAAGLGAWFAAGALTRSVAVRAWVVLVWVAAPVLAQALAGGRLGGLVVHAGLPWLALGVIRAVGVQRVDVLTTPSPEARSVRVEQVTGSLGAAAAAGLALVLVTAGAPVLLPVVCLGLVVTALLIRAHRRHLVLIPVPALVLFAPYYLHAARTAADGGWRLLFADPGQPAASTAPPPWQLLLGQPTTPRAWFGADGVGLVVHAASWAPFVAGGIVVALALWAAVRGSRVAVAGWTFAALGVATAVAAGITVVAQGDGAAVYGWPGAGVSLALAGLLGAAVVGLPRWTPRTRPDVATARTRLGSLGRGIVVVALAAVPAAGLASWTAEILDRDGPRLGSVTVSADVFVPPVGQQMQQPPRVAGVLALAPGADGSVQYSLLRGDGPQAVDASAVVHRRALTDPGAAQGPLPVLVAQLVSRSTDDIAARLGDAGVGAVLLPAGPDSADRAALTARLDMVVGLERITEGQSSVIWRVSPQFAPSWAWIDDGADRTTLAAGNFAVDTTVAAGGEDRVVALASNAASGWHATVDGRALEAVDPVDSGGLQAFRLGSDGGHLEVYYVMNHRIAWLAAAGTVLVIYLLLAVPVRRRKMLVREAE